jgi:hypothetical protein
MVCQNCFCQPRVGHTRADSRRATQGLSQGMRCFTAENRGRRVLSDPNQRIESLLAPVRRQNQQPQLALLELVLGLLSPHDQRT